MASAVVRKSVTDLTRRKARSFLSVLTLALAVAGVGLLAVPSVMKQAMDKEVASSRSPDVTVSMKPLALSGEQLAALGRLPNVTAVEARNVFATRVWVGARREQAIVIGVRDYAKQHVDIVRLDSGRAPGTAAVLSDQNNARTKGFDDVAGGVARLIAADDDVRSLTISGVGRNLTGGEDDPANDWITFYATPQTVAELSGKPGYTTLAFRLRDNSRAAAERTVAAARDQLRATTGFEAFDDMPVIQEPGTYPGQDAIERLSSMLKVITLLALLSALVLVSNTMTTLIGDQTGEIASMKAIGARRRDIRRLYLRTALLLGALGAVLGAVLGVLLANALVGLWAAQFFGVDAGFGVSVPVVLASVALGLVGPPLAALPAIRRATRLPLGEALRATGSAVGGQGRLDAALRRVRMLPRSAQIGLRGVGRRKRRTAATTMQVSLAVATLLALLSLGSGVQKITGGWFDDNRWDVSIEGVASQQLGADAQRLIRGTPGVEDAQAWLRNEIRITGEKADAYGLPVTPMMNPRVDEGRWYTAADVRRRATVAVIGRTLSKTIGKGVGDRIEVDTSGGAATLRVIGISANQASQGRAVFLPLATLQRVLGATGAVNNFWITTTSDDHALIDRTTTRIEDSLGANGIQVGSLINYDAKQKQIASNRMITTSITVLGLLIVAISMVGLVNSITMSVLERTREIGMLRSIGARARDVRRIFATEGLVVSIVGWLVGVPLGYGLAYALGRGVGDAVGLDIAFVFPLAHVGIALVGTVMLALVVMLAPLRRAAGFTPGEALRHA